MELRLVSGRLELVLAPGTGGSIARLDWVDGERRTPVLRRGDPASGDVLSMASFPLVPYVNRIRGGRFSFRGREVVLQPNMAGDPSPLHGQGWLAPWQVAESSEANTYESHCVSPAG